MESPHAPHGGGGGGGDDFAWLDVEGAVSSRTSLLRSRLPRSLTRTAVQVATFLPDALHSDAGWQVPLGSYPQMPVRAASAASALLSLP